MYTSETKVAPVSKLYDAVVVCLRSPVYTENEGCVRGKEEGSKGPVLKDSKDLQRKRVLTFSLAGEHEHQERRSKNPDLLNTENASINF